MRDDRELERANELLSSFSKAGSRNVTIDVAKYQAFLDEADMSPEDKEEYIKAVFSIVMVLVDLGFGVHPLQEVCGKDAEAKEGGAKAASDRVNSGHPRQRQENPPDGPEVK